MADGFKITVDHDIDIRVAQTKEAHDEAMAMAGRIARIARATAPVGETGAYKAGIGVQSTKTGARVYSSDYKSTWIEFGVPSKNIPATFNLRRAVEAAGYRFRKGKR